MALGSTLAEFFVAGLATPLTAACALPLYPGFLVYLSSQADEDGGGFSPTLLGVLVLAGVIAFMGGVGLLFSFVLRESLTGVIGVVSPVAFVVLALVSVALILDLEVFSSLPAVEPPQDRHPVGAAFGYGFFFGAIVLPCNPGTLTFLLARQFLVTAPVEKLLAFLAFGVGIGVPLLALAALSESFGRRITRTLARNRSLVNRVAGVVMLGVSVYYLLAVFDVFGLGGALPGV
jgi:cytochrome c-type biogenesis protein